jgi:4-amino-4-deoxy-L-arabinose transferase-like glycosyltransferase
MDGSAKTFWKDYALVGLYSLILFGFAGFSGRPLTMHEARLPQTSREMLHSHDWLLPTSGGRPWLERPPLPHWLVISAMKLFGHDDRVWIVRLPSAVMGTLTVLMSVYIADKGFGRTIALMTGFVLATSFKFYQYACLAEDDVYLAALISVAAALLANVELSTSELKKIRRHGFLAGRPRSIVGFFAVLGLSNLTKGPLLGIVILGSGAGMYLLLRSWIERSIQPLLRYVWLWGWLVLIALTVVWPWWAQHVHPDVWENWKYDYLGRLNGAYTAIDQPWWYYPPQLFVGMLPWAPFCLLGLVPAGLVVFAVLRVNRDQRPMLVADDFPPFSPGSVIDYQPADDGSASRFPPRLMSEVPRWRGYLFTLCFALTPLVVLSIPHGKHDHYLVPFLLPWAMLGAIGLVEFSNIFAVGSKTFASAIVLLLLGYCVGEKFIAPPTDHTVDDTAFLLRCRDEVPANIPLYVDGKLGPPGNLDFFRIQFYSRPDAKLLHNLSYLRDEKITAPSVYVITRQRDERLLRQLGTFRAVDQSPQSHEITTYDGRFTLYCLTFDRQLKRYPLPAEVSSLQAMERAPGPWCGPPMP